MKSRWSIDWVKACIFLFCWSVMSSTTAAPEYVTAWPKQVPVEQPDPVLGDKPYWEHWVYGESFARRFVGTTDGKRFSVEKSEPELKGKLHALVLRIYKTKFWDYLNNDYPEQYACEIDAYFDAGIDIPLKDIRREIPGKARRPKQTPGPHLLVAANKQDREAIEQSIASEFPPFWYPAIFALPADGRAYLYGSHDYRANLAPGLAFVRLIAGRAGNEHCPVAAPSNAQGGDWLSLKGTHPYRPKDRENQPDVGIGGSSPYNRKYEGIVFDPGPDPDSHGLFRVPRAFHDVALQKAALVKVMNWCIAQRYAHANPHPRSNMTADVWKRMDYRCEQAERYGRILPDPRYHPDADGLMDTGY